MPQIAIEKPRPLCPAGPATFRLKSVEAKEFQSYSGEGLVTRWIWSFISNRRTPEGDFYELAVFTGQKYGNSKAKLTWLLDMLQPGITAEQAAQLNTDAFVGMDFEGSVKHVPAEKDPNQKIATFLYLRPVGMPAAPIVPPMDPADPFVFDGAGDTEACKVCSKALTDAEVAGCVKRWKGDAYYCTDHARAEIERERAEAEDLFAVA